MGKPTQKRLEKKRRKAKEKAKARRGQDALSGSWLPYRGSKFKRPELVPFMHRTETAIYEAFVITKRQLTDRQVRTALVEMIDTYRGEMPKLDQPGVVDVDEGEEVELVRYNILRNWLDYFEDHPRPPRDQVVGVLRTILGSLETWNMQSIGSRGYLKYLEGFLEQTGVSVREVSEEELAEMERDGVISFRSG